MTASNPQRRKTQRKGVRYLPKDDRPVPYDNGMTEELELGLDFLYEVIIRDIYRERERLQFIHRRLQEIEELEQFNR